MESSTKFHEFFEFVVQNSAFFFSSFLPPAFSSSVMTRHSLFLCKLCIFYVHTIKSEPICKAVSWKWHELIEIEIWTQLLPKMNIVTIIRLQQSCNWKHVESWPIFSADFLSIWLPRCILNDLIVMNFV